MVQGSNVILETLTFHKTSLRGKTPVIKAFSKYKILGWIKLTTIHFFIFALRPFYGVINCEQDQTQNNIRGQKQLYKRLKRDLNRI